ncbi:MAG TPA: hypothetical protein VKS79_13770, partial [Gemmataceae bacterium]|nr:hypothetical protein [Gemmataceae bacterium]
YLSFRHFDFMAAFSMYYFAGAIFSEERRRAGQASSADEFLYSHDPRFRTAFFQGYDRLIRLCASNPTADERREYQLQVHQGIAPFNTAGLCDRSKKNMYPYA